jgi:hypothetical protein
MFEGFYKLLSNVLSDVIVEDDREYLGQGSSLVETGVSLFDLEIKVGNFEDESTSNSSCHG